MSTIELVDPELRDALAQWQLPPLTAESLMQRRADALELTAAVPKPNLPDIAADEIHVQSAFGAKPIRVLTYRPKSLGCRQQWRHSGRAASARHGGEVSSRLTPVDNWPSEPEGGHVGHRRSGFIPTIELMPLGRGSTRRARVTLHLRHGGIRLRIPPPAAMSQSASIADL